MARKVTEKDLHQVEGGHVHDVVSSHGKIADPNCEIVYVHGADSNCEIVYVHGKYPSCKVVHPLVEGN